MATNAAASKVLNTVELLESIILQLPCKDVVVVQRVSKTWIKAVAANAALQKVLGFVATEKASNKSFSNGATPCMVFTQADVDGTNTNTYTSTDDVISDWYIPTIASSTSAQAVFTEFAAKDAMIINPLFPLLFSLKKGGKAKPKSEVIFCRPDSVANQGSASWKKMYLTQPPATEVNVCNVSGMKTIVPFAGGYQHVEVLDDTATVKKDAGVTIGHFVEHIKGIFEEREDLRHLAKEFRIVAR